jgi:hypothetical protein
MYVEKCFWKVRLVHFELQYSFDSVIQTHYYPPGQPALGCDLCDGEARHNVDEHSAKRIVDTVHKEGGRFIGREYKSDKFYVMSKEEAIKLLTEDALSHVHVAHTYINQNDIMTTLHVHELLYLSN